MAAAVLVALVAAAVFPTAAWAAGTAAGTSIRNQAVAEYRDAGGEIETVMSNEVVTVVAAQCVPSVVPDGSVLIPGQRVLGLSGTAQWLSYRLTNSGNAVFSFDLSAPVLPESTHAPSSVTIYRDLDGDGAVDPGEPAITAVDDLAVDATVDLVMEVVLPSDPAASGGTIYVDLLAACRSQPSNVDARNVSRVDIATGGISREVKRATPSSGTTVSPGGVIDYEIYFDANDVPLADVVVTDVLDPRLAAPTAVTEGTVTDSVTGQTTDVTANFNATTRELVWNMATIPAGMTVRLAFQAQVAPDATADTPIDNNATIAWGGETTGTKTTNATSHDVEILCVPSLGPDGTVSSPAATATPIPGATAVFPYTFENLGNATLDFTLSTVVLPASTTTPSLLEIVLDTNGNGVVDPGEPVVTQLGAVPPGAQRNLLLVVEMPADALADEAIYVDLAAACTDEPTARDEQNVVSAVVPSGGIDGPAKTATPTSGTTVAPGDALSYQIAFTANGLDLIDVVVTDAIDAQLADPATFTNGAITDPATGLTANVSATFDTGTRTITWTIDRVPATMTVRLDVGTSVTPNALAGQAIDNQANVTWSGASTGSVDTGVVTHTVADVCSLTITPDGTTAVPAYDRVAYPGDTVVLPYVLTNTGNGDFDIDVAAQILSTDDPALVSASLVQDLDGDGVVDAGEPTVTTLAAVPPGANVDLLLVLRVGGAQPLSGEAFVDVVGACAAQPASGDQDNVARLVVPAGGFADVVKTSDPVEGSDVYPGADIQYQITFRALERTLRDVVITDPLHPALGTPRDVTQGVVTDPESGLSATVTATVTADAIVWTIPEVPAGMTVTLSFASTIIDDADPNGTLTNTACMTSQEFAEVCTNTLEHPIEPLEILIQKTADPAVVTIGANVTYTLEIVNPATLVPLDRVVVIDNLPDALRYQAGSSVLVAPDGSTTELATSVNGQRLTWDISPLAPEERKVIRFDAYVTIDALEEESLVNTVEAQGLRIDGRLAAASFDSVATVIDPGVFRARSVLLGHVFIDRDADGSFDDEVDTAVPDVRLFLPDGVSTITDRYGRYTFQGMTAGLTALRVDTSTLPPRLLQATPHEDGPGTWRVRLQAGTIQRVDIPLVVPKVDVDLRQRVLDRVTDDAPTGDEPGGEGGDTQDRAAQGAPTEILSRVIVDLQAWDIPAAESLTFVFELDEGERYVAGSLRVDGQSAPEPGQPPLAVVVPLEDAQPHRISFQIAHARPTDFRIDRVGVVGFFPDPDLLMGRADALAAIDEARTAVPRPAPEAREREGILFLRPQADAVVRDRDAITVAVDMPLGVDVELFVRDEPLPPESIGKRVYDRGFGRQTFEWVGVELLPGPNPLRVVTTTPDGDPVEASTVVYLAGRTSGVEFTPQTRLEADSVTPVEIEIRAVDAWGNIPQSDALTLEIVGAQPTGADARPGEIGYQVRLRQGRATLQLQPFEDAGTFTISTLLGGKLVPREFVVLTPARPPIVVGLASLGVGYRTSGPATGLRFGYDARFFAQTSFENGSLFTVAANSRLAPLGLYGDPYQAFPVPGAEQPLRGEAASRHGVYVRWERDLSFIAYGDFQTPDFGPLSSPSRSFTGAHAAYHSDDGWRVQGFAAFEPVGGRVEGLEIPSDGTSVYRLPVAPVETGSVRVRVIKRDAFDDTVVVDDDDPLTGDLELLVDYTVDERIGVIRLSRPLPLLDDDGDRYVLVVSFTPVGGEDLPRAAQLGVQAAYAWDGVTMRVSGYQLGGSGDAFTRVVAAGAVAEGETGRAVAEVAYGADQASGGVGVHVSGQQALGPFTVQGRYEFRSDGFRSVNATDASNAGHDADATVVYEIDPTLALSANGRVTYRSGTRRLAWGATLLGTYQPDVEWTSGETLLGRRPTAQLGIEAVDTGARLVVGGRLGDPLGAEGSDVQIVHRQGLGPMVRSTTDIGVGFRILDNLTLRLTERFEWGNTHAFFVGLEQVVEHRDLLASVCSVTECVPPDGDEALGRTTVVAQYQLDGGVPGEAGRARLGVTSQFPIDSSLSVDASVQGTLDLADPAANEVVLGVGSTYQTADLDADARFEVRLADLPKYTFSAGVNAALDRDTFGSVTFDYLHDAATTPTDGLSISVAGAYRGDVFDLLTKHEARWGSLAVGGVAEIYGDTRISIPVDVAWDARAGYLYRWRADASFLDMIALGTTFSPWDGGQITGMGRLFHDWTEGDLALGVTLEAAQRIGCGVYGVGGVNLFNRFGLSTPSIYTEPGPYIRLDIVVDEQWSCGLGSVAGTVFGDRNADGLFQGSERGLAGVHVTLATEEGAVQTVVTDGQGRYVFERVMPGDAYVVRVDLPERFRGFTGVADDVRTLITSAEQVTAPADGAEPLDPEHVARTSDIDPATGATEPFRVGAGQRVGTVDIGIEPASDAERQSR